MCKPPSRPQPHTAAVIGEGATEYFIICGQQVVCKLSNLKSAVFIVFSCYYCYNLEYPQQAKNIFYIFQDYILGYPDSAKKTGGYLGVVSDIKRHI